MQKVFNVAVDISRKLPAPAFEVNTNDLKSVKLNITIVNGQTQLDLTDTTVRIAIRKPDNNIIFQDCTIKDAKSGQVEIILENQAYITPGTHTAEIMCYKGSEVVAVSGTFSYKSTKGIMNDEAVESKSEFTTISNMMKDVQETIDDIRKNGTGVDAKARQDIQSVTTQLAEKVSKVNGKTPDVSGNVTIEIPQVDTSKLATKTELQAVASGSPKGTYATKAALDEKFPTGNTNIYVVSADGKWYHWNGTAWTPGGVYQSTSLGEKTVTANNIDTSSKALGSDLSEGNLIDDAYIDSTGIEKIYTNKSIGGVTGFIAVTPGEKISYFSYTNASNATIGCYYNESKVKIGVLPLPSTANTTLEAVVPEGAAWTRVNYADASLSQFYVSKVIDQKITPEWLLIEEDNIQDKNITESKLSDDVVNKLNSGVGTIQISSRWKSKKANFLGDSITQGHGITNSSDKYPEKVKNQLDLSVARNYGIGGTLITKQGTSTNSFVERYNSMDNDADLIIVFGGINDYFNGTGQLGEENSTDIITFYGALNTLMVGLQNKYVGKEIVFLTPLNSYFNGKNGDQANNNSGVTLKQYADAIIKRANYYSIPVLDTYRTSGMDLAHNANHRTTYAPDGVHPNPTGMQRLSDRICAFLNAI